MPVCCSATATAGLPSVPGPPAIRPAAPPTPSDSQFQTDLTELRTLSTSRTSEQTRIANFWADGAGTATPPGHWDQIMADIFKAQNYSEVRFARNMAYVCTAMADAAIACWDAKFTYWWARPQNIDNTITSVFAVPNFPGYVSGHSSFSGAACLVGVNLVPSSSAQIIAAADEASVSRVYGGIHFRFDCTTGATLGQNCGTAAWNKAQADGAP